MSTELTTKQHEAQLTALRNLNSLTRLVQDIDQFTASRDLKNIVKAQNSVSKSIAQVRNLYEDDDS